MLDGIVLWGLGVALGRQFGPGRVQRAIETIGRAILLTALAPFLLLLLLMGIGRGLFDGLREYRRTGRWPRNESFIARVKARRSPPP